ncbi:MAG: ATP-dependent zinc metalloprotease FtsH [Thermodesulfobacteriota bacterium]
MAKEKKIKTNKNKDNKKNYLKGQQWSFILPFLALAFFFYLWSSIAPTTPPQKPISYSEFMELLDNSRIRSVTITGLTVKGELFSEGSAGTARDKKPLEHKGAIKPITGFTTNLPTFQGEGLMEKLRKKGVTVTVASASGSLLWQFVFAVLPWVLIIGFWVLIMRRSSRMQGGPGGLFAFGASKAKRYDETKPGVTFADVAGLENVKTDLMESIEFLRDPERFKAIGAKVPRGVLLVGPPGTGKTLLARATAGEAEVPFFSISASEFIEMFVGVGAARVRDMFKKARESQPSIIFIDELDSVGRTRGAGLGGGHDEREQTLNQLLSEMDGFEAHEEVIVMAATNRPDVLDAALLRPGRFDRNILIDRPGLKDREAILKIHSRNINLSKDVNLARTARGTPGMTGADLENIVNEAALNAARAKKNEVSPADFEEAIDKVLMGSKRTEKISEDERRITAYHEAGHTLVALSLPNTDPIHKVTIIPRGMAMGVTQLLPSEDRHFYPKNYLISRLTVALGGRVSEKIIFNDTSTGAQNDLKEATGLAEKMVSQWGMSDEVGPINLGRGEEHPFLGMELSQPKRYSDDMAWLMDQEIRKLIIDAEVSATEILESKRASLENLAKALLDKEELETEEIERIVRESEEEEDGTDGYSEEGEA